MAINWDAVILNDYEAVMPLTWKKKLNIKYIYQPAFFQQGGIISPNNLSEEVILSFLEIAFKEFSFAEFTLNFNNTISDTYPYLNGKRNNYIFHLKEGAYLHLNHYILKRVSRASKNDLYYKTEEDFQEIISLYKNLYQKRLPDFQENDFLHFTSFCEVNKHHLVTRKVIYRNEMVAAVLLICDNKRLYNIISCILPEGKKLLANYFLYHQLIKEFENSNLILDFEGSDQPGIAFFYKKFADENQPYPFIKMNRLPAAIKLFKR